VLFGVRDVRAKNAEIKHVLHERPVFRTSRISYFGGLGIHIFLPISKGQLAGLLGTIPETLSRIFKKMSRQNLIEVSCREIKLSDRTGLDNPAEHGKL